MTNEVHAWANDNQQGREEADAIIDRMRESGCPVELLRRLDPQANASGKEVGFINRLAERLLLAA